MSIHRDDIPENVDIPTRQDVGRDRQLLKKLLSEIASIENKPFHAGFADATTRNRLSEKIAVLAEKLRREAALGEDKRR